MIKANILNMLLFFLNPKLDVLFLVSLFFLGAQQIIKNHETKLLFFLRAGGGEKRSNLRLDTMDVGCPPREMAGMSKSGVVL